MIGTFDSFQATYGKPLLAARDSKCSDKEAEAGALVMEALHKQEALQKPRFYYGEEDEEYSMFLSGTERAIKTWQASDSLIKLLSDHIPTGADIASELHKLHHSPKLVALQQILEECGIGLEASNYEGSLNI
ncbi:hypothetical protein AgCh_039221 [Apium graveolens]